MASDPPNGARPESLRPPHSTERLLAELRRELDHALDQLALRDKEARTVADEAEAATVHALRTEIELQGVRRLLGRLKGRIAALHERARGTSFEAELLDLHTILEIHAPPIEDDNH